MNNAKLLYKQRALLLDLIRSDFKSRYLSNHLGILWAFIQPLSLVMVYWIIFTYGLKTGSQTGVPFLIWMLAGMVPWFFLNDAITNISNSVYSQSYLVKKIVFEVRLLPYVKVGSSLLGSTPFLLFLVIICLLKGYYPNFYWLQIFYFITCIIALSLSVGLLFAAIMPFIPDLSQLITVILQILFWATPIMWNAQTVGGKLRYLALINPITHITEGFRGAILFNQPFWSNPYQLAYFWAFVIVCYLYANHVFNQLRPQFADVL